jgi:hypothetical protein
MRITSWRLRSQLLVACALVAPTVAHSQTAHPAAAAGPASTRDTLYSSAPTDFVIGKTVYLRSSKMRIGTIEATDASHSFPRSFPRPRMKAVLIRRNGGRDWVPVEGITRIYVVNK